MATKENLQRFKLSEKAKETNFLNARRRFAAATPKKRTKATPQRPENNTSEERLFRSAFIGLAILVGVIVTWLKIRM